MTTRKRERKRESEESSASSASSQKKHKADDKINQTLYINNLNDKINIGIIRHNLYLLCSSYGDVIDIIMKPKSHKMRGQAHIIFSNVSEASMALVALQKFEFFNKPMAVQFAKTKSKVIKLAEIINND